MNIHFNTFPLCHYVANHLTSGTNCLSYISRACSRVTIPLQPNPPPPPPPLRYYLSICLSKGLYPWLRILYKPCVLRLK